MKKDEALQTMIEELWLLRREELEVSPVTMRWLKKHFVRTDEDITHERAIFIVSLHARHVRGIKPGLRKTTSLDAYAPGGRIRGKSISY